MDSINLTQEQLKRAIAQWEALNRAGGTQGPEAMAAKTIEEVAAESSDYLFGVLQQIVSG
ncbi:hypothetical protein D3C87_1298650 [compost metagenome]